MVDIENHVKHFAEKYDFVQQSYIENIEIADFDRQTYYNLDNKNFISINKYTDNPIIECGKIIIYIEYIDDDEIYYINKNAIFFVNVLDYPNENILIEEIVNKCKIYNLI